MTRTKGALWLPESVIARERARAAERDEQRQAELDREREERLARAAEYELTEGFRRFFGFADYWIRVGRDELDPEPFRWVARRVLSVLVRNAG